MMKRNTDTLLIKVVLICVGLLIGILIGEIALRGIKGVPERIPDDLDPPRSHEESVYYRYVDIYEPFFKKTGGQYVCMRPGAKQISFPCARLPNEKRVFVAGESVAYNFKTDYLKEKLSQVLPQYTWRIINCGMGGYDSYRIRLVAKEILAYKPDLLVVLMGNNTGVYHIPVKLDHWIYKYKILSRFWVTRLIFDALNRPLYETPEEADRRYMRDLSDMAAMAEKMKVPVALCTLPNISSGSNKWDVLFQDVADGKEIDLQSPDTFMELTNTAMSTNTASGAHKYNLMARAVSKERSSVILVDFENRLLSLSGGKPDYGYFVDAVHYWNPVYAIMSDEIIESIYRYNLTSGRELFAPPSRWQMADHRRTPVAAVLNEDLRDLVTVMRTNRYDAKCFLSLPSLCAWWHQRDPAGFDAFARSLLQDTKPDYRRLIAVGLELCSRGELARGLHFLDTAITNEPGAGLGYVIRGICYCHSPGNKPKAYSDFSKAKGLGLKISWPASEK